MLVYLRLSVIGLTLCLQICVLFLFRPMINNRLSRDYSIMQIDYPGHYTSFISKMFRVGSIISPLISKIMNNKNGSIMARNKLKTKQKETPEKSFKWSVFYAMDILQHKCGVKESTIVTNLCRTDEKEVFLIQCVPYSHFACKILLQIFTNNMVWWLLAGVSFVLQPGCLFCEDDHRSSCSNLVFLYVHLIIKYYKYRL